MASIYEILGTDIHAMTLSLMEAANLKKDRTWWVEMPLRPMDICEKVLDEVII